MTRSRGSRSAAGAATKRYWTPIVLAGVGAIVALGTAARLTAQNDTIRLEFPFVPMISMVDDAGRGSFSFDYSGGLNYWAVSDVTSFDLQPIVANTGVNLNGGSPAFDIEGILRLNSARVWQDFVVDAGDNEDGEHGFVWYQDACCAVEDVQMWLRIDHDTLGDRLQLRGTVQISAFDVAESFLQAEPVEPGDVVSVDPSRPDAVRRSRGAYDPAVLGVVSSAPGLLLGGTPFSAEDLGAVWGEDVAQEYQLQRGTLVERILAEDETLRDEAARLSSLAAFTVAVAAAADEPKAWAGEPRPAPAADPSPEALRAAWEELRQLLARTLEDRALALFFDRRFVAVALSGRVPVKADAGQGAIRPGDYLAAGPIPGTAIKATSPGPVIGIALEGLAAGRGPVMSLLRLGWHGGQPVRLAGGAAAADLEAKDAEIEELRRRLARLEAALAGWEPGPGAGRAEKVAAR